MTVLSRTAHVTLDNGALGSSRAWAVVADVQDTSAGGSVVLTTTQNFGGAAPPGQADTLTLSIYNDAGGLIRSYALNVASASQTSTFYFTADGTSGGAARSGTVEIAIRATKTTGLAATQYDCESDGAPNTPPTGFTATALDRGWIRGTTTATTVLAASTDAAPVALGYSNTLTATTTLGAAPFLSRTVSITLTGIAAVASAASTSVTFTTALGLVDNRFSAAAVARSTTTAFPNATLTGLPWTTSTPTEATQTVDPRLTYTHLHQDNDNTFGTPPTAKEAGGQRLASNLAFLTARLTNANGAGQNGITWAVSLQDAGALVTAITRTVTSATQGGQTGWGSTFLPWESALPTGTWNKTTTITAPAGAVGLGTNTSMAYVLVASNPNLRLVCGGGPATIGNDAKHFTPGVPLLLGLVVFNITTATSVALDSGSAAIAVGRFNLTFGRAEYLAADGVTWSAVTGGTTYYWPATVSPGDPNAYTVTLVSTASFSVADLFVIGKATVGGTPVSAFQKEIVTNGFNQHDVADPGVPVTPAEIASIANAVWDELTAEARTSGSYGEMVVARLDAAITSRGSAAAVAGVQTDTSALLARLTSTRALLLDNLTNLDALISTRATHAEATADPAGVTTLLTRLTATRAGLLDALSLLDVAISTRATPADVNVTAPNTYGGSF